MSNKGLRLVRCVECNRKRFCSRESIANYNFKYTCSKGHTWVIKGVTAERVVAAMKDTFTKEKLTGLFDRDDAFYKELTKRR
jgi:hypothetical protein